MSPFGIAVAVFGGLLTVAAFGLAYWDAQRVEVSRPLLWATITAVPVALGTALFLLTDAPMTGVLLTANTGTVLYGFEREITTERGEPREPGTLPEK